MYGHLKFRTSALWPHFLGRTPFWHFHTSLIEYYPHTKNQLPSTWSRFRYTHTRMHHPITARAIHSLRCQKQWWHFTRANALVKIVNALVVVFFLREIINGIPNWNLDSEYRSIGYTTETQCSIIISSLRWNCGIKIIFSNKVTCEFPFCAKAVLLCFIAMLTRKLTNQQCVRHANPLNPHFQKCQRFQNRLSGYREIASTIRLTHYQHKMEHASDIE